VSLMGARRAPSHNSAARSALSAPRSTASSQLASGHMPCLPELNQGTSAALAASSYQHLRSPVQLRTPVRRRRQAIAGQRHHRGWVIALRLIGGAAAIWILLTVFGLILTHVFDKGAVHRSDLGVDVWFAHHRSPGWNSVMLFGTDLATTQTVIAVAAAAALLLRWWLKRWHESFIVIAAVAGEVLIFLAVTETVPQRRPPVPRLQAAPPTSSYPSGHTAAAVALYGSVAVLLLVYLSRLGFRWLATVLFCVPVYVAISRLYEGEHYPSDVIAGALLGSLWLTCVLRTLPPLRVAPGAEKRHEPRVARQ
jgi:membrane-associated phospholipid phosphatase